MKKSRSIVFICVGNACRSQMAEGLARHLAPKGWQIHSAGSHPAGFVAGEVKEVLAEIGIDTSGHYSKGIDELPLEEYDVAVGMGCGDSCPTLRAKKRIDWLIPDPFGKGEGAFRRLRDDLEKKIRGLFNEMTAT